MVTGAGTSGDPYILSSLSDLEQISVLGLNKYYRLGNDIDASGTADHEYNGGAGWLPLGTFTGNFNCNGYKIIGLYINRPETDNVGFFSQLNVSLSGFTLEDCNVIGKDHVGGIAGYIGTGATFTGCSVGGNITGHDYVGGLFGGTALSIISVNITTSTYNGNIEGNSYVGGIIGRHQCSKGNISSVTVKGVITATGDYVGGVAGEIHGENPLSNIIITNELSINTVGDHIGGIAGYISGPGTNTSLTVNIDITGHDYVGGLFGGTALSIISVNITNSSYNGNIEGNSYVGGIIGRHQSSGGSISSVTITGTINATGSNIGGVVGSTKVNISDVTITNELSIIVSLISDYVGGIAGYISSTSSHTDLTVNIDITGHDYVGGLFGGTALSIISVNITNSSYNGNIEGNSYVGGIIGRHQSSGGSISSVTITGTINATGSNIGGVVGSTKVNISDVTITNELSIIVSLISDYVGGIAGYISSTSSHTDLTVNIDITGHDYVGGLFGGTALSIISVNITNSSYNGNIEGNSYVGGIIGRHQSSGGSISSVTITGTINATGSNIGGVVGSTKVNISDVTITNELSIIVSLISDYVGGIAGYISSTSSHTDLTVNIDITGHDYVGGLFGGTALSIISVNITTSTYNGNIEGNSYVGGIIGIHQSNSGGIVTSYTYGTITATGDYAGGIVGYTKTPVTNSYSFMTVTGNQHTGGLIGRQESGLITNSYSIGRVTGTTDTGGLVGSKNTGTATDSYWNMNKSTQGTSALGTGKTQSEMKDADTYSTWDTLAVWQVHPMIQGGYPFLRGNHHVDVDGFQDDTIGPPLVVYIDKIKVDDGTTIGGYDDDTYRNKLKAQNTQIVVSGVKKSLAAILECQPSDIMIETVASKTVVVTVPAGHDLDEITDYLDGLFLAGVGYTVESET